MSPTSKRLAHCIVGRSKFMLEPRHAGKKPGLQIEQDLPLQLKIWKFERVGWGVLALIVAAGVVGLFGDGPFGRVETDFGASQRLKYERFLHNDTQSTMTIPISHGVSARQLWLTLSAPYAAAIHIDEITPEPDRTIVTEFGTRFLFATGKIAGQRVISLTFTPTEAGPLRGSISSSNGRSVAIAHFVYP